MLLTLLSLVPPAAAETLEAFAEACELATGVRIPDFDCDDGTLVPVDHPVLNASGEVIRCDAPGRLGNRCDTRTRFLVLEADETSFAVALCRSKSTVLGQADTGRYEDIAVIQHNRENGATCFYQALDDLSGEVESPRKGDRWATVSQTDGWMSPVSVTHQRCVGCHDNGPLIRSPHLTGIQGVNRLPGAGEADFNMAGDPYWFVGEYDYDTTTHEVHIEGNPCVSCHRLSVNDRTWGGSALDFGPRSTGVSETAKSPHSPDSPVWMPPSSTYFDPAMQAAAQEIQTCASNFRSGIPTPPGCTVQRSSGIPGYAADSGTSHANVAVAAGRWDGSVGRDPDASANPRFRLTLDASAVVQIDLRSSVDTFLYLLDEYGSVISFDDDSGAWLDSRISWSLGPGTYVVVASTYSSDRVGSFELIADHGRFSALESARWSPNETLTWLYEPTEDGPVRFDLKSPSTDNHLALQNHHLVTLASDDDSGGYEAARIDTTVLRGRQYLLHATPSVPGTVDDMFLGASSGMLQPVITDAWTNSAGRDSHAIENPSYVLVLESRGQVDIDLLTTQANDAYLYLMDAQGNVIETADDREGYANRNSRITASLDAGFYFVTAATFFPGKSGTFYLTTSRGELGFWF